MHTYCGFLWQCLKWAYGRWGKEDRIITIILTLATVLGVGGGAFGIVQWGSLAYLLAIPFILIFFVAPYKLWKKKADKIRELTTKRLKLEVESQPEVTQKHIWYHLIVHNLSGVPIKGCYAQLMSFNPNISKRPYQAFNLPWSSFGGEFTKTITIPPESPKYLDVVMTNRKELYIVTLHPDPRLRGTPFPEPPNKYEAEIQVGSEEEKFEPSKIKLIITLDKNGSLHVEEQKSEARQ